MLKILNYLIKPILAGVVLAFLLLLVIPYANQFSLSFNNLTPQLEREEPPISFADAVDRAGPAVVNIYNTVFDSSPLYKRQQPELNVAGSGVIMRSDGYILTNIHVIKGAEQLVVMTRDGKMFYDVKLIGQDLFTDLAVLKIEAGNLPVIPTNPEQIPRIGDMVFAIGNPYNLGQSISQGIISATGRVSMATAQRQDFLQTDAAINQGNSGGALVNSKGELVGINTASFRADGQQQSSGINFAIPYKLADKVMRSLISHGKVTRGCAGLTGQSIPTDKAPFSSGVAVTGVTEPARSSGIQLNDVIIRIMDIPISSGKEAMDIIAEVKPGNRVPVTVIRNGEQIELKMVVGELADPIRTQGANQSFCRVVEAEA